MQEEWMFRCDSGREWKRLRSFDKKLRGDSKGGMDQSLGIEQAMTKQFPGHLGRVVKDDGRFLKTRQDLASQGPEPPGPGLLLGCQQTTKRIQVMAVDTGPTGRQAVQ